jgi:hypothetical protein
MGVQQDDFGFCGGEYTAPNFRQDAQKCVNWYPEISQDKNFSATTGPSATTASKTVVALLGCPGLIQVASVVGL